MRNKTKTIQLCVLTAFFIIAAIITRPEVSVAATPQAGNLIFILDASGSMWGQVEGKAKIAIAKEVLTGLIKDLPQGLNVGLVAYGHRRKGDCNDVEELVPLSALEKEKLIQQIKTISPKGKTPITQSVRITAEKLKTIEDETTIILVSDGKETCEGDPCALVRTLKQSGVRFVMHVIGFDVTDEERKQLECIAKAGGGMYYSAKNAGEFRMAATKVVRETQTTGFLTVIALRNGKAVSAHIDVFIPEKEENVTTASSSTNIDKPLTIRLKPGSYAVRVTDTGLPDKPSITFPGIEVEVGKTVEKTAEFTASYLNITAIKEGKPFKASIRIFRHGEKDSLTSGWTNKDEPVLFNLPPGLYDIMVEDSSVPDKPVVNLKGVEIKAGEIVEKVVEFSREGMLEVAAVKEGKPFGAWVYIHRAGEKKHLIYKQATEKSPASFKLLPGSYDIKVKDDSVPEKPVVKVKGLEVKAGETLEKIVEFTREGMLEVAAVKEGKPFGAWVYIHRAGEKKHLIYKQATEKS
ncbi:MAG: VWA domain-containing protein, partial [Thermodesulfobacteriota bacterium]|nr:VWA domain-containing protein [Thermodesulfobacteriota bacterium]